MFVIKRLPFKLTRSMSSRVMEKMNKHGIIPDVIDVAPKQVVHVVYPSGVKVDLGNVLTPTQVKDQPTVKWCCDRTHIFAICMTDPDAPSRKDPKFREWHHWLVVNIPGDSVEEGDVLSDYIGSGPPEGTSLHRYVFLVYRQKKKMKFKEKKLPNNSAEGRGGFCIKKFACNYNLRDPVAGNFFRAEYDDYVPYLYKKLGA